VIALLDNWPRLRRIFSGPERILLCLDFDGTLAPIVRRPGSARLAASTGRLLAGISSDPRFAVAIVSGRSLREVRKRVGIPGIIYAGNHGLELQGPGLRYLIPRARALRPAFASLLADLRRALRPLPGVSLEGKGLSLSVHFRRMSGSNLARLNRLVAAALAQSGRRRIMRLSRGKKVLEFRPRLAWDKGRIVCWLRRELRRKGDRDLLPVYVGDDRTDEDAFRALSGLGVTVRVGRPRASSAARYFLRHVGEVRRFLFNLRALRRQPGHSPRPAGRPRRRRISRSGKSPDIG